MDVCPLVDTCLMLVTSFLVVRSLLRKLVGDVFRGFSTLQFPRWLSDVLLRMHTFGDRVLLNHYLILCHTHIKAPN